MCGIAGIISFDPACDFTTDDLRAMSGCLAHRGPDGEGVFTNHDAAPSTATPRVGLVHRRLSVIDPDPRSNQPFTIGPATIVFNGEIYNYRELRAELSALRPDYAWRTSGDTEVLLMSYLAWGGRCVEKLNGMFAVAVWDQAAKSLWLARDRMGQKPLYVIERRGMITFASEPNALAPAPSPLRAEGWGEGEAREVHTSYFAEPAERLPAKQPEITIHGPPSPEPSPRRGEGVRADVLAHYLRFGHTGGRALIGDARQFSFDAQQILPGGAIITTARPGAETWSAAAAVRQTRACVTEAVHRQLVADVPLGCFLSGGIDSSVIALCARKFGPLETFSCGFVGDASYDESIYAAAVAKHLGTKHHAFKIAPDAAADLPKIAAGLGEPFGDSSILPTYYLARETHRHVTVALDGTGGDELFGGYDRYVALHRSAQLDRLLPRFVRGVLGRGIGALPGSHPKGTLARLKRFARGVDQDAATRYAGYTQIFDDATIVSLCGTGVSPVSWIGSEFDHGRDARATKIVPAALAFDRRFYLPFDLLAKTDRASMMHALEVRSPFMDPDVVDLAEGLTTDQLLRGGKKRLLREAFAADLPAEVFTRKKMGFAVPIGEWFRAELRPMLRESLLARDSFAHANFHMPAVEKLLDDHHARQADHTQRLFALLMLELWWSRSLSLPRGKGRGEGKRGRRKA